MKDIKFRAWNEDNCSMCDVRDIIWNNGRPVIDVFTDSNTSKFYERPCSFKLLRFTGCRDVNGTELYEDDLCLNRDVFGQIVWNKKALMWGFKIMSSEHAATQGNIFPLYQYFAEKDGETVLKKVGNIYENPLHEQ